MRMLFGTIEGVFLCKIKASMGRTLAFIIIFLLIQKE